MTLSSSAAPRWPKSRIHLLILLSFCGWLFLIQLGDIPFLGKDEPKNAEALREMYVRGDWVTTTLFEEPWFDKPILYYWVSLIFFHLLGPGELAARLASALFASATVFLTWWFARRLFHEKVAMRAGIILASGLEFFWYARTAVVDLPLTFCVTLAVVAFYMALEKYGHSTLWYLVAFAAVGGATLAKGPVGVALPGLVVGGYFLASRPLSHLRQVPWVRGVLVFLMVAAPWYGLVMVRHGRLFLEQFILNRNLDRYLTTVHHHPGPFYYYLPVLVLGLFPWGGLVPFTFGMLLKNGWRDLATDRKRFGYLLLWILLPMLFFSFAGSKLPSYMLPSFPALAILIAWGWEPLLERVKNAGGASTWVRRSAMTSLLLAFPLLAGGIFYWCRKMAPEQIPAQTPIIIALMMTFLALLVAASGRLRRFLFPICAGGTLLSLTLLLFFSLGTVKENHTLVRISRASVELVRAGTPVVAYRNFHNYLFYYTENRVPYLTDREELDRLLEQHGTIACLVESSGLEELSSDPGLRLEILDRQHKVTLALVHLKSEEEEG